MFTSTFGNKAKMIALTNFNQHFMEGHRHCDKLRKERKDKHIQKGEVNLSFFADDLIIREENLKESTKTTNYWNP